MMKHDYLFDKTGEPDADIERLETILAEFRGRVDNAPELPVKLAPFVVAAPRRRRTKFAAVAAVFAVTLFLTAFVLLSARQNQSRSTVETVAPQIPKPLIINQTPQVANEIPPRETPRKFANPIQTQRISVAPKNVIAANPTIKKTVVKNRTSPIKLTKQETYAYDQLMLALSVTSSKLKIVKDKAESVESPEVAATKITSKENAK